MVRPLTKYSKAGELYERPPGIVKNIEGALGQDLATLTRRALETDRSSPDYLKSECLVHLIRDAIQRGDQATYNSLLPILFGRCEVRLRSKIPDTVPYAEQLRGEVLGELGVLFAEDATSDASGELDFYECKFNTAFMTLRFEVLNKEKVRTRRLVPLRDGSALSGEEETEHREYVPGCRPTQDEKLLQEELLEALPPQGAKGRHPLRRHGLRDRID